MWTARLARALLGLPVDHDPPPPPPDGLRAAAVLLAVDPFAPGVPLLFIERGPHLSHHPGQVAFPGGAAAPGDPSAAATALREAEEEVGIRPTAIRLLGQLPARATHVSGFMVTPVVGTSTRRLRPRPDGVEVTGCFGLPLGALLGTKPRIEARILPGSAPVPTPRYELLGRTIWGVSAGILHDLLERLGRAP